MVNNISQKSIADNEFLARFVVYHRWIRKDKTVKQDAFIPCLKNPKPELSVTRHIKLKETELWKIGQMVIKMRETKLYGRADITAYLVRKNTPLQIESAPLSKNKNHANIINWPINKSNQKILALQLANCARFIPLNP